MTKEYAPRAHSDFEPVYLLQPATRSCDLDVTHRWGLPGTTCPQCEATWASVGLDYPALDLSAEPFELDLREGWLATWDQYQRLRDQLARLLPPGAPISPGSEFGPSIGTSKGPRSGAIWPNPWTVMFAEEALQQLSAHDLVLPPMVRASIRDPGEETPIFEAALEPLWLLAPASFEIDALPCDLCNREGRKLSQNVQIRRDALPTTDLVRAADFTTQIFATERFRRAAVAERVEGLAFTRVVVTE